MSSLILRHGGGVGAENFGIGQGDLILGVAVQYLLELIQCVLIEVLMGQSDPKVQTGLDQFGLEAHRLGKLSRSAGGVTVLAEFQAKTEMSLGKIGLQTDGLDIVPLSFSASSQLNQSQAKRDMDFGVGGIELERVGAKLVTAAAHQPRDTENLAGAL